MIVEQKGFMNEFWVQSFLDTFEKSIDSIVITTTSPEEHFLYVNEAFKIKTGYSEAELLGKSPRILQGPQTNRSVLDQLKENLLEGKKFIGQNTNYRKDGSSYIVHWYISALKNPQNEIVAYVSYQKEITQAVWDHNHVKLLSHVVDQVDQMVLITDLSAVIVYVNQSFLLKYGYCEEEVLHKSINFLKSEKQSKSFYRDLWNTILAGNSFHGLFVNEDKNKKLIMEQKTITPIKYEDGDVQFFVSIGQDITEIMNQSDSYKDKAYKDALTGLHNRLMFDEVMQRKFQTYKKDKIVFSIIMIDIDNFKTINDTYGHDKGDEILKNLASVLKNQLRKDDLLVRWGGEEFTLLIDDNINKSFNIAEKLRLAVKEHLSIEGKKITISLGTTQILENDTQDSFFKRVDNALYESKHNGKNKTTVL